MSRRESRDSRRPPPTRPNARDRRGPADPTASAAPSEGDLPLPLLQALHLANADGSISADMRRKLKQVSHLLRLFRPTVLRLAARPEPPLVWEFSCGSSYLGLLLLHEFRTVARRDARYAGVDRDPARIDACRRRAAAAGFPDAEFVFGDNADAPLPARPAWAVALHACDTATDAALLRAVGAGAEEIALVPCCHRELRRVLKPVAPHDRFLRDGMTADEYCALLTDVARAARLRAAGYRAEIVEFVPLEHSARNRLLRASASRAPDPTAAAELADLRAACTAPPAFLA